MSIRLMTEAWKSDMPSGRKMVLLALCDNANDQGECYPSISMLAEKCSMSERSVFNHIADLEKVGAIARQSRTGRSTVYTIDPCKFCTPANSAPLQLLQGTPANSAPTPLQPLHPTPATVAPITINEPSIEPSDNHKTRKSRRLVTTDFVLPDWIPADAWAAFMETRKTKKAKSTAYALGLIVKSLEAFKADGHDPLAILNASIKAGWSDVYPPKVPAAAMTPARRTPAPENFASRTYTGGKL